MSVEPFIPPVPATTSARRITLPIAYIDVPTRIRAVNPAQVDFFAAAIGESGFKGAITVRPATVDGRYELVAGAHRLAAMVQLGRLDIPVDILDMTDPQARLWEIEENLVRHELNAPDRMIFLLEAKRLRQSMDPASRPGGDRKSTKVRTSDPGPSPFPRGFSAEMAEKIGVKRTQILADIACAEALGPELLRVFAASRFANNRQALIVVSQMPEAQRRGAAQDMIDGRYKTAAAARDAYDGAAVVEDPQKTYFGQLERAWNLADAATRLAFLHSIDAAYLTAPKDNVTADIKRALGWEHASPSRQEPSPAPSRGGRKPGKGAR